VRRGLIRLCWWVALAGCSGSIDEDLNRPPGITPGAPGSATPVAGGQPGATLPPPGVGGQPAPGGTTTTPGGAPLACADERVEPRAVLVPPRQYVNLLQDVVGPQAVSAEDAAASAELLFDTVDRPRMTTATLDRFVRLAEKATETLRGQTATFLACPSLMDPACVRGALNRVAHRVYKRPVAADELDSLMALRDTGVAMVTTDQGESGALAALQAILIAPSTMYRTEFYAPAAGAAHTLTPHERAAALAAFLLDSVPDDPLLAAADDGTLGTDAGLQAQVDRLLLLPRVRTHVTNLIMNAYNVPRVYATPKDLKVFPEYTPELQTSMYESTRRFIDDVLWTRRAPLSELFTSRRAYVDPTLAKHYGVAAPASADFAPVDLGPERSGLLTQASVLTALARTDKNSVVSRGLYVRGNLLCLPKIPGPPASVQAQVNAQLDAMSSERELAAYRAMTSPCMGCHSQFDRFGLLLEQFDAIGRYTPANAQPTDFTGLTPLDGVVNDASALTAKLEPGGVLEACLADRTLSYALTVSTAGGGPCLASFRAPGVPQQGTITDLVAAVAKSPAFGSRSKGP
jgi:hypothetical protein